MRKILVVGLSIWGVLVVVFHLMGHEILPQPGPFGIPYGNLMAWTGLITLPAVQLLGLYHKENREADPRIGIFQTGAWASLLLSALWGPMGYGLSGNWSFSFSRHATAFVGSPEAAEFFRYLSIATGVLPLLILLLYLIYRTL